MPLTIGTQLGIYEILAPLGKGGMGEVYRARDSRLGREVAVKIIRAESANDVGSHARFEREAKLLAQMNHINIAIIHGLEESDGQRFLVMELVAGDTLADLMDQGRLATPRILGIARQIADALEAAHLRGIIHRDLKPANVKVTPDGRVKLLDFGLAKSVDVFNSPSDVDSTVSAGLTGPGAILGTPAYMSPEQARGLTVGARTDIWALGCILFEMLSGARPFAGATRLDLVVAILERQPKWETLPAETPARLRKLVVDCLAKEEQARPDDAGQVRGALEEVLAQLRAAPTQTLIPTVIAVKQPPPVATLAAPAVLPVEPGRRPQRGSPKWVFILLFVFAMLVAFCGFAYLGVSAVSGWVQQMWPADLGQPEPTIAVLPFTTGDPFSKDGEAVAETINRELVNVAPELQVIAHSAASQHKDPNFAGNFLKTQWLVHGKIELRGKGAWVITVDLIEARTKKTLWRGEAQATAPTDRDAARAIAEQVRAKLAKK